MARLSQGLGNCLGWSFGADVTLSVAAPEAAGCIAIAPPLRYGRDFQAVAEDPRPKLVLLAAHDEFRPAAEVAAITAGWTATTTETVAGASHFFVGRTDRLVDLAATWTWNEISRDRASGVDPGDPTARVSQFGQASSVLAN